MEITKKYFEERSLYSPFRNVILEAVFDFLREMAVFKKIVKCDGIMFASSVLKGSCKFCMKCFMTCGMNYYEMD